MQIMRIGCEMSSSWLHAVADCDSVNPFFRQGKIEGFWLLQFWLFLFYKFAFTSKITIKYLLENILVFFNLAFISIKLHSVLFNFIHYIFLKIFVPHFRLFIKQKPFCTIRFTLFRYFTFKTWCIARVDIRTSIIYASLIWRIVFPVVPDSNTQTIQQYTDNAKRKI